MLRRLGVVVVVDAQLPPFLLRVDVYRIVAGRLTPAASRQEGPVGARALLERSPRA